MYQTIHEPIWVVGIYKNAQFIPKKFKWKDQELYISEITLSNNVKDGAILKRWYSVIAENNLYRIEFNRTSEQWQLLEIWVE
ncbi:MAG: hypothetical protein GW762_04805 [Candidatus Pacebacteria bacterium]|nr:hypothetical protein [Candidatus Paceibacterota bacterium]PIR63259.1 MAG: hypothetical protein COU64_05530 [Candidatus Pacebacteria bacterium CG10_big_fil_rev_8_21_14_0_10_40_26]PIZ78315.1 MAG: hypothetical protein COY01_06055 [Candidatus Pacebacteria bacterium CG_4_10_14_0_2_um_filter_40_20]PJA68641.1 MAG: hypothetical protein CO156_03990 [Candidatus Pacebacteria bacterium CG_4_9_14_3_um_filter_40_12]PJC41581.1 MAG: hypothetical protein CO041_02580 [Candidatus Pacebacteria bacterium CG_4_9_